MNDKYLALAYSARDCILDRWVKTSETYYRKRVRTACYLSAEYLLGPHLGNNLLNLGAFETAKQAMEELGLDFEKLLNQEEEPGLGNGGLGRLAACYLDSLATLEIPSIGYGIRYEFGIFDQLIRDGWQVEMADKWLHLGNPWEIPRPEIAMSVGFGGHTEPYTDEGGRHRVRWIPARFIKGVAHDTPILGYRVNTANLLRLWSAEAVNSFDLEAFNIGAYCSAVEEKVVSETISKVLYPNDTPPKGKKLRLEQQYFLVSCALQDMIRIDTSDPASGNETKLCRMVQDLLAGEGIESLARAFLYAGARSVVAAVPSHGTREIIRRAFDLGITHFDLANNYGPPPGTAEETLGRILHSDLGARAVAALVKAAPGSARLHQLTAELLESEGDFPRAVDQYRKALEIDPSHAEAGRRLRP